MYPGRMSVPTMPTCRPSPSRTAWTAPFPSQRRWRQPHRRVGCGGGRRRHRPGAAARHPAADDGPAPVRPAQNARPPGSQRSHPGLRRRRRPCGTNLAGKASGCQGDRCERPGGLSLRVLRPAAEELFHLWKKHGTVTGRYYDEHIKPQGHRHPVKFSTDADNLLRESAFCFVPAAPIFNYLGVLPSEKCSMSVERMGSWSLIVEGPTPIPRTLTARPRAPAWSRSSTARRG